MTSLPIRCLDIPPISAENAGKIFNLCVSLFADDTALYTSSHSYINLMLTLRMELAVVSEWLAANKWTLNVTKTKYVIFGKNRQLANTPNSNLQINGQTLSSAIARMHMHIYAQLFVYMSHLWACALGASCLFVLPVDDHVLLKKFLTKV